MLLRVEDLDGPRVKPGADQGAIEDLAWLGVDWDSGPVYQATDLSPYHHAIDRLGRSGRVYRCWCTRGEIEQAQSAPHADDHELRYPGTCRPADVGSWGRGQDSAETSEPIATGTWPPSLDPATSSGDSSGWTFRVVVPDADVTVVDELAGSRQINVQQQIGDFVISTKSRLPAYQLAVVVDDTRQQVTEIVRGNDLLPSTARQQWLYRMLDFGPLPRYWHLPLVVGPDGRRLAKRHGDSRLAHYRGQGVSPHRVVGLLACWSGLNDDRREMDANEFVERFDIEKMPKHPAVHTPTEDAWLME